MTHTFKAGETYLTRNRREVRIYATDGGGTSTIHGAIRNLSGHWNMALWSKDGRWVGACSDHHADIMPPKRQVWVAVWDNPAALWKDPFLREARTTICASEAEAERVTQAGTRRRIAVLGPIDLEAET